MDSVLHYIPTYKSFRETKVGIYCRVSTNSTDQLKSLSAQVSGLTRLVAATPQWVLADVYMDMASAKSKSERKEYNPAIISKEVFEAVRMEKARRSNMIEGNGDKQRKNSKYSSKKK